MVIEAQLFGAASALALVGLAEIGDKSHLMAMALGARHPAGPVLAGAVLAYTVLNLLAVTVGAALAAVLPPAAIAGAAALVFAASGVLSLRDDDDDHDASSAEVAAGSGWRVALSSAGVLLLAEVGDRTQLAVSALAAAAPEQSPGIWLGATVGMLVHAALGIWVGRALLQRLPERAVRRAAAGLFFLFAALAAWQVAVLLSAG
jgi:putative Ca2+/H+ antiporter (TMEM165/GDT1 family)